MYFASVKGFKKLSKWISSGEVEMQGMLEDNTYHDHTLREIHHRIKNHFYIITGYIQMKRMIGVESVDCLFRDIENRIRAVGLIHEKIYTAQNLVPDTRSYITELSKLVIADMAGVSVDLQDAFALRTEDVGKREGVGARSGSD